MINGRTYMLEPPLHADFAFVKAWKGDRAGNLVYRKTARNFNPMMATAARHTIAEVEHLVEPGALDPRQRSYARHLREAHPAGPRLREAHRETDHPQWISATASSAASRADLRDGDYVNLGIGMPTLVANCVPAGHRDHAALRERHARRRAVSASRAKQIPT